MEGTKPTDITPSFCPFLLEIRLLLGRIAASISPDSALTLYSLLNEKIADALMQLIESTSFKLVSYLLLFVLVRFHIV